MKVLLFFLSFILLHTSSVSQPRYSVLISEIMADPSPQISLPSFEWLELKNTSSASIDLAGWRIRDQTNESGMMPSFLLAPDSIVIVCGSAASSLLSAYGRVITVSSFPSLDNDGEEIAIINSSGQVIHAVHYNVDWYANAVKKDGGWSLEMKDSNMPCLGRENWSASNDMTGGTPGKSNSNAITIKDEVPPRIRYAYTSSNFESILVFDEPLDSLWSSSLSNFSIDQNIAIIESVSIPPYFDKVRIRINDGFEIGRIYQLRIDGAKDCSGNAVLASESVRIGMPSIANTGIVVNEILFNPRPNAFDYVEIKNVGDSIIDASTILIANRNASGDIASQRQVTSEHRYLFPGDFYAVTADADNLSLNYLVRDPNRILEIPSLPSFPDDEGVVMLINSHGEILDEVSYSEDWHFSLISDPEGVALERIDPLGISNDSYNWHSAASTAGYGTPGYENSQYLRAVVSEGGITIEPKIFSPDNDGVDDIATIKYKMPGVGNVANISIYDASGRLVHQMVKNHLLGPEGSWTWNGLDAKGNSLPIGIYLVHSEVFNTDGKRHQFKNVIILARRLK